MNLILVSLILVSGVLSPENPKTAQSPIHYTNNPRGALKLYLSGEVADQKPAGVYHGNPQFIRSSDAACLKPDGKWRLAPTDIPRKHCAEAKPSLCGLLIEGQQTNYIKNNYFAADTSNWTPNGATLIRVTDKNPPFSSTALKIVTNPGSGTYQGASLPKFGAGTKWHFYAYLKDDDGTTPIQHFLGGSAGWTYTGVQTILTPNWTRYSVSYIETGNETGNGGVAEYDNSSNSEQWYFTLGQAVPNEIPSTIIPNSGATAVTRAAESLAFRTDGNISAQSGRLEICFFTEYDYNAITAATGNPMIFYATDDFKLYFDSADDKFVFAAGGQSVSLPTAFVKESEQCLTAIWRGGYNLMLRLNDSAWQLSQNPYTPPTLDPLLYIASDPAPANHLYGAITKLEVR
ncbi:MAG: hypothetical protein Kow0090_08920 [Myxococcota bacterium]